MAGALCLCLPPRQPVVPAARAELRLALVLAATLLANPAWAFEGRLTATVTQGGQTSGLLYTVSTNHLRIEKTDTNWPWAKDLVDLGSGATTLVFPHNRSFVRLKPQAPRAELPNPGAPSMPVPPMPAPAGVGPQPGTLPGPSGIPPLPGPTNPAGMPPGAPAMSMSPMPAMPKPPGLPAAPGAGGLPMPGAGMPPMAGGGMPMMPMLPEEPLELQATGQRTNLLGFAAQRYELKRRGEILEVWATDQLFPFQPYQQGQRPRFGPRLLEEQWPELLKARRLFPLRVSLRFESGPERYRFEVTSVKAGKVEDPEGKLFQPPPDYHELEPLPF